MRLVLHALREALGERARLIVQVPVERLGEVQALRGVQAERVDVGDEQQQTGKLLAAGDDAELGRLLDRVGGVAAGIGEADDLRLRGLRLQQERGEVRGVERMAHRAEHLAAVRLDHRRRCHARAHDRTHSPRSGRTRCRRRPSPAPCRCRWRAGRCRRSSARCSASIARWSGRKLPRRSSGRRTFFSLTTLLTASATLEVGTSAMASTFSTSSHCRAMLVPTSGLFW